MPLVGDINTHVCAVVLPAALVQQVSRELLGIAKLVFQLTVSQRTSTSGLSDGEMFIREECSMIAGHLGTSVVNGKCFIACNIV